MPAIQRILNRLTKSFVTLYSNILTLISNILFCINMQETQKQRQIRSISILAISKFCVKILRYFFTVLPVSSLAKYDRLILRRFLKQRSLQWALTCATALISSIGGQMGLWLGISLISFYDWAVILLRWWRNRKHGGYKNNKILEREIEMTLYSRTSKKY